MIKFGLIEALESYALGKGWKFVYKFDDFYGNIEVQQDYNDSDLVLTADVISLPLIVNGNIAQITYTTQLALGRKFDIDSQAANLDESFKQKYDRRLSELQGVFANAIADFACSNELEVNVSGFIFDINVYDTNIDFVISTATFTQ